MARPRRAPLAAQDPSGASTRALQAAGAEHSRAAQAEWDSGASTRALQAAAVMAPPNSLAAMEKRMYRSRPRPEFPVEPFRHFREQNRPAEVVVDEDLQRALDEAADAEWFKSTDPAIVEQRNRGTTPPGLQRAIDRSEGPRARAQRKRDAADAAELEAEVRNANAELQSAKDVARQTRTWQGADHLGRRPVRTYP